jgi:hypothetical protein
MGGSPHPVPEVIVAVLNLSQVGGFFGPAAGLLVCGHSWKD